MRTPLISLVRSDAYKISTVMEKKLEKCFDLLISKGANCNARDDAQMTALHFAVIGQNHKAIQLLTDLKVIFYNNDFYLLFGSINLKFLLYVPANLENMA